MNVSKKMYDLGSQRLMIREIFEHAMKRATEIGPENVLNFSIGNPSTPAPEAVKEAIVDIVTNLASVEYNSYTSANGTPGVRKAIADNLNKRFGTKYTIDNLYMTSGASGALNAVFRGIIAAPTDEIIALVPFFPEYTSFVDAQGGKLVVVDAPEDMTIDLVALEKAINKNTKAIIVNNPNNPSGIVYNEELIKKLAELMKKKEAEVGHAIYLISDEPYRELVFGGAVVPFIPNYYANTILCYSWSKSLSLPGQRIGYILVPSEVEEWEVVYAACAGAARILGHVNASSLYQHVIERCIDVEADMSVYEANREILYTELTKIGYTLVKPDGAFYVFIKSPNGNAMEFYEEAKKYDVLLVPGNGFGSPDYARLAYCCETEQVKKAIPLLKKVFDDMTK